MKVTLKDGAVVIEFTSYSKTILPISQAEALYEGLKEVLGK